MAKNVIHKIRLQKDCGDIQHVDTRRMLFVCVWRGAVCLRWGVTDLFAEYACSLYVYRCGPSPYMFSQFSSVSTLPSPHVRVTHYGLSKQMACPQRWYNFLGGGVLRNQMPPQHTRGECNFLLSLRKTKTRPTPIHCPASLLISTATWILLSSGDCQLRVFRIFWAHVLNVFK